MMNRFARNLSPGKKLILAAAAAVAVTGPFAFGIVNVRAQTALQPDLHLDVVSVKIVHGEPGGAWDSFPVNGTWHTKHISITALAAYAYEVDFKRIEGIPKALQTPDLGFDIVAKTSPKTSRKDFRLMIQSLLVDRFKAVIHTENRDVPVIAIEVAKGGAKLRPASGQCVEVEGSASVPADQHRCHEIAVRPTGLPDGVTWEYSGWSVSMAELAAKLSNNGLVVDDTGLSGLYDFDVKFESHRGQDDLESENNFNYDWKTAWEKQAGLTIDRSKPKKRPGTVVLVDHIELPTPN